MYLEETTSQIKVFEHCHIPNHQEDRSKEHVFWATNLSSSESQVTVQKVSQDIIYKLGSIKA